jgi:sugar phosphate isomerase/epimerase
VEVPRARKENPTRPILFSVTYAGLWGQARLTLEEFIPRAAALGYAGVELMGKRPHLSPLDWTDDRLEGLRGLCARHALEVACVAAYTNFTGGAESREVPFGEMQVQYVESLCRMAQRLGCSLVRVFTAYERDDLPMAAQWEQTAAAIRECCRRAAPYGVTIGIQNHHDVAVHTKSLMELMREIAQPNCRLMLDPWSMCMRGEEIYETAKGAAPHVAHTTVADYVRLPRFRARPGLTNYSRGEPDLARAVPIGEGDMENALFLSGLRAGGYDGPVAYEICSPMRGGGGMENLDQCARAFVRWLKQNAAGPAAAAASSPARSRKR